MMSLTLLGLFSLLLVALVELCAAMKIGYGSQTHEKAQLSQFEAFANATTKQCVRVTKNSSRQPMRS